MNYTFIFLKMIGGYKVADAESVHNVSLHHPVKEDLSQHGIPQGFSTLVLVGQSVCWLLFTPANQEPTSL